MFGSSSSSSIQGLTRKHSSRMRTTSLRIVCVVVATTRCHYWGGYTYLTPAIPTPSAIAPWHTCSPQHTHPTPQKNLEPDIPTYPQKAPGTMHTLPHPKQNDRHLWKHYLPTTSLAGGNYIHVMKTLSRSYFILNVTGSKNLFSLQETLAVFPFLMCTKRASHIILKKQLMENSLTIHMLLIFLRVFIKQSPV